MSDDNDEVRDCATFTLDHQRNDHNEVVHEASWARVSDDDFDIRSEAILGLVRRLDERAMEPLLAALHDDCVGELSIDAAAYLGDEELTPAFEALKSRWD
jgi:HEAT repeat protein